MIRKTILTSTFILSVGAALAHQGVKNPAVMERMNAMSAIAEEMKTLGAMSKGAKQFDAAVAQSAAKAIAEHSARTVLLFAAPETDPKSEALPAIWDDFSDFTSKADDLTLAATDLSTSLQNASDLRPAMARLGATCKSCHQIYRE